MRACLKRFPVALIAALVWAGGAAGAELMVCYAQPDSESKGPVFIQEKLRCAAASATEERGVFVDLPRGLAELYEKGWRLIQVLERHAGDGLQYVAFVEKR
jgi:hypothetical protein